jgi:hypothetical protein
MRKPKQGKDSSRGIAVKNFEHHWHENFCSPEIKANFTRSLRPDYGVGASTRLFELRWILDTT